MVLDTTVAAAPLNPTLVQESLETEAEIAAKYLANVATDLRRGGLNVVTEQPEGAPVDVIIASARRTQADLIALTTHGRSGLGRLIFGSVAEAVLRAAACPVVLVRART